MIFWYNVLPGSKNNTNNDPMEAYYPPLGEFTEQIPGKNASDPPTNPINPETGLPFEGNALNHQTNLIASCTDKFALDTKDACTTACGSEKTTCYRSCLASADGCREACSAIKTQDRVYWVKSHAVSWGAGQWCWCMVGGCWVGWVAFGRVF
jgi:hypothetical protein